MADARSATDPVVPSASRPKLLTVMLVSILAAGSAAAGVYFLTAGKTPAPAVKAEKPAGPTLYIKFDPPFVVNFEARGMTRFLQIGAEVVTRDAATAELIKLHDPRLRNDLLMLLGGQSYETLNSREGKERLRQEALQAVAQVIASEGGNPDKVEQLYFTSFVMQ